MLDSALRPVKHRVLHPLARALGGVHPNAVSLAGFAAGLAAAALLARGLYAPALALWLLNRVLDGLDGELARTQRRQSDFGAYLDILLDFAVYALVPLGLALGRPATSGLWPAVALLLASFYVNAASWMYLAALLERRGRGAGERGEETGVTMPGGLVEGTETIALFSALILLPGAAVAILGAMAALVLVTVAQRLAWAARAL